MYLDGIHSQPPERVARDHSRPCAPDLSGYPYGVTSPRLSQSWWLYIITRTPMAAIEKPHLTVVTSPSTVDVPYPHVRRFPFSVRICTL